MRRTHLTRSVLNVNELYASLRNKFGAESVQVANFNENVTLLNKSTSTSYQYFDRFAWCWSGTYDMDATIQIWCPGNLSGDDGKGGSDKGVYSPHSIERCVIGTCSVYFNMARSFGIKHFSYFEAIDEKKRADDVLSKIDIRWRGRIYINAVDVVRIVANMKEELG